MLFCSAPSTGVHRKRKRQGWHYFSLHYSIARLNHLRLSLEWSSDTTLLLPCCLMWQCWPPCFAQRAVRGSDAWPMHQTGNPWTLAALLPRNCLQCEWTWTTSWTRASRAREARKGEGNTGHCEHGKPGPQYHNHRKQQHAGETSPFSIWGFCKPWGARIHKGKLIA